MRIKEIHIESFKGTQENGSFLRYLQVQILAALKTRGLISVLQYEKACEVLRCNRP